MDVRTRGSWKVNVNAVAFFGQGAKTMGQGPRATGLSRKDPKESDQLQPSVLLRKRNQTKGGCRKKLIALRLDMDLNQKPR